MLYQDNKIKSDKYEETLKMEIRRIGSNNVFRGLFYYLRLHGKFS